MFRAGRPAFARPYVGVHKSKSLMSSSLLLQQCPACLVCLTWIVFVIGGRWPYSWCLVGCLPPLPNLVLIFPVVFSPSKVIYLSIYLFIFVYLHIGPRSNVSLLSLSRCIYIYIYIILISRALNKNPCWLCLVGFNIYIYIYVCVCVCVNGGGVYLRFSLYAFNYTHTRARAHTHTHTHTYIYIKNTPQYIWLNIFYLCLDIVDETSRQYGNWGRLIPQISEVSCNILATCKH